MKRVSIIIVTYNSEKEIYDCVRSIQQYADIPSEEIEGPVENIIPVDAKVPGCAVRPQDVLSGVVSILPKLLDAD